MGESIFPGTRGTGGRSIVISEAGGRRQEAGVRSQESGVRSQEAGGRRQESGVRSQEAFKERVFPPRLLSKERSS
ncbi:hypothetical protein V0288_09445 [Pannus brasiliensis CCIBt3594]|uniref:Uncharacterized protein n=1 Tax=Pannus brasiliensis CCIBt3594 TaxID=1427578 RepID=A0AAW9QHQ4_9CHRO